MHMASSCIVGSISRRFRWSTMMRNISQTSLMDSKCWRRSPISWTTLTSPHACSSRMLVLTLERATLSRVDISSAVRGAEETWRRACTWATVRLIPQRAPISPQCRMNRFRGRLICVISDISVITEITERCQAPLPAVGYNPVMLDDQQFRKSAESSLNALKKSLIAAEESADFEVEDQAGALHISF